MTGTDSIDTGIPGIEFSLPDLRPIVTNEEAAQGSAQDAEVGDRVVSLIALGRLADASEVVAEARLMDPANIRYRLLDTEVSRWSGDPERAIYRLRQLRKEFEGTDAEADILQHLAACFYTAGDIKASVSRYKAAYEGRQQAGAPERLIESSRRAYQAAVKKVNDNTEQQSVPVSVVDPESHS